VARMCLTCDTCNYKNSCTKLSRKGHHEQCHSRRNDTAPAVDMNCEVEGYLNKNQFMNRFLIINENQIDDYIRQGLPYKLVNGLRYFPVEECYRWLRRDAW
jgi:hypothetical protein